MTWLGWTTSILTRHLKEIVVGVLIIIMGGVLYDNLDTFIGWLVTSVPLWLTLIFIALSLYMTAAVISARRRIMYPNGVVEGMVWEEYDDVLYKAEIARKGSMLFVNDVDGPFCKTCKTRGDLYVPEDDLLSSEKKPLFCPNCGDFSGITLMTELDGRRAVKAILEGRIARGDLTRDSMSIKRI